MKWKGRERSSNVEDRRGMGGKGIAGIGGGVGIILLIVITLMGGNPTELLGDLTGGDQQNTTYEETAQEKEAADFVSVVLADTERVWTKEFKEDGKTYKNRHSSYIRIKLVRLADKQGSPSVPFTVPVIRNYTLI